MVKLNNLRELNHIKQYYICALTAIPILVVLSAIILYDVDVPFWDEWVFIPLLEKFHLGKLSIRDLWFHYGEQRPLLPTIFFLVIARISRFNHLWLMLANVIFAFAIFFIFVWQIRITQKAIKRFEIKGMEWLIPFISLMVFSLAQFENFYFFLGSQYSISLGTALIGIVLLTNTNNPITDIKFITALLLGISSIFSFFCGVVYLILGPFILLFIPFKSKRKKILSISTWFLIGSTIIYCYFIGYSKPPHHPPLVYGIKYPLSLISYIFSYLGAPILRNFTPFSPIFFFLTLLIGFIGFLIFLIVIFIMISNLKIEKRILIPYISIVFFSIGSAFVTAFGRVGFGWRQAVTASRYTTISNSFWISIFILIFLMVKIMKTKSIHSIFLSKISYYFFIYFLYLIIFLSGINSALGITGLRFHYLKLLPARAELFKLEDEKLLHRLNPDTGLVRRNVPILKAYKWSLFRVPSVVRGGDYGK